MKTPPRPPRESETLDSAPVLAAADELVVQSVAKLDRSALGIAVGIVCGAVIFLATNFLVFKGGAHVGATLSLLSQYFYGYTVTFAGSFVGLFYGFAFGFALGWLTAFLRNFVIKIYLFSAKYKERLVSVNDFLDQ